MMFGKVVHWLCFVAIAGTKGQQQFFTREPSDVAATQGGKVVLPCQVQNKGGVLQWTRDGFGLGQNRSLPGFPRMSMVGSDSARDWDLEISPVQLEDEAVYQCQVTSARGTMPPIRSATARLIVLIPSGPPRITNGPSLTMTEGVEDNLRCEAEGGKPAAQLEWRVDGVKIKNIQTETEKMAGSVTFKTISNLKLVPTKADDGVSVSCFISTTGESSSVELSVMFKPDVKISHDKTIIAEGDTVVFNCDSSAKPDNVLYTWIVDDEEIVHSAGQEHLVIEKISRQHNNAWVKCLAQNSVGVGQDQEQIKVYYKPRILTHPRSVTANEGITVQLECSAQGNPTPAISWYKVNSTELVGTGQQLSIYLDESSAGLYYCSAHSAKFPSAVISHRARVTISRGPTITSAQEQEVPVSDGRAMVRCKADTSALEATVEWRFKEEKIISGNKYLIENIVDEQHFESILTISEAEEDDFGHYLCTIENALGKDSKDILVSVYFEGVFNDLLLLQVFLGTAGLLTCILSVFAVKKFCHSLQHSFGSVPQIIEDEADYRSDMYRDKVLREIIENNKETKVMSQRTDQHPFVQEHNDVSPGHVLHAINMDYAAFYGNHHLSNNMAGDDSDDDEPEQRTFSSHPYLIT